MTTEPAEKTRIVNLTINGKAITVPEGTTVYHAAVEHGFELPTFCYQDRMPPFGACRVCLVEVEKMHKLQTSCTLVATEGMVVNTQSRFAAEGRKEIFELLLINHPLDCPICDKGGECPLQDQTMEFGPGESHFYEHKRVLSKHVSLGPLLMLDRERCIVCARCTRFGDLVAGDNALEFIERGYKTEIGTPGDKPVESKFIGNTIMICPVGALTSDVYRFRARPWDNRHTPTACTLCPVGCSMTLDQRDGEVMRTRSLENREVNDIWMCDKGWFGYEYATYKARLQKPMVRRNGVLQVATWEEALTLVAEKMRKSKPSGRCAGWGGNPLTFEECFRFQKLMREGGGTNHLDHRVGMPLFSLEEEGLLPGMEIALGECEKLSYAFLLGLDITEEFPVAWLRLKQGINNGTKAYFTGHYAPEVAPHLQNTIVHPPGEELSAIRAMMGKLPESFSAPAAIFVGRQYLSLPHRAAILAELLDICKSHSSISLNILEGRGNSFGARLAGMHPAMGPFYDSLAKPGFNVVEVLEASAKDGWEFLYVAGADPAKKYPSKLWKEARAKLSFLVVQDIFMTETARQADVVFPALCAFEKSGTFVNISGHFQRLHPGKEIPEGIYSDYEIFRLIADKLGVILSYDPRIDAAPLLHDPFKRPQALNGTPHASFSPGKLRAVFVQTIFDKGVRMQHNPHLLQTIKEPKVRIHPQEAASRNLVTNDMVRVKAGGAAIIAPLQVDKRVSLGVVVLPLGFDELPARELSSNLFNGLEVEIAKE